MHIFIRLVCFHLPIFCWEEERSCKGKQRGRVMRKQSHNSIQEDLTLSPQALIGLLALLLQSLFTWTLNRDLRYIPMALSLGNIRLAKELWPYHVYKKTAFCI